MSLQLQNSPVKTEFCGFVVFVQIHFGYWSAPRHLIERFAIFQHQWNVTNGVDEIFAANAAITKSISCTRGTVYNNINMLFGT